MIILNLLTYLVFDNAIGAVSRPTATTIGAISLMLFMGDTVSKD
jgi:hypothetical protein